MARFARRTSAGDGLVWLVCGRRGFDWLRLRRGVGQRDIMLVAMPGLEAGAPRLGLCGASSVVCVLVSEAIVVVAGLRSGASVRDVGLLGDASAECPGPVWASCAWVGDRVARPPSRGPVSSVCSVSIRRAVVGVVGVQSDGLRGIVSVQGVAVGGCSGRG